MAIDIKLPRVNNCCCCCSLKCGVITIAVVFMVVNLFAGIWVIVARSLDDRQLSPFKITDLVLDAVLIILCIILLIGAIKGNYMFCMIWVFGTIILLTCMMILLIVASTLRASNRPETVHRLGFLWGGRAIECGVLVYGVIVVNSFAQTLRYTDGPLLPLPYRHVEEPVDVDI
ncbi:uncharacterized protein [Branchiostoma lanceolatum]|uniref:uncharacterized protein n=1 Tax=Branchiostoma lanceolatum TaxID=7740 RepID=UPI00345337FC